MYDVAIVGAGVAGMATAARLQARGLSTIVFESHGQPGGCAGFYRRKGFSFDVGATTLVDFGPEGIGGELLASIGLSDIPLDFLPGYIAWLPDKSITLHRDHDLWNTERLSKLGSTSAHQSLWRFLDHLALIFWQASRRGIRLPIQQPHDMMQNLRALQPQNLPFLRYLRWTLHDALTRYGIQHDWSLRSLLAMLVEDTVHSSPEKAPLINAALGITIRGAGLARATGGMYGFWERFRSHYQTLGGVLRVGCAVTHITGHQGQFVIHTRRGDFQASQVVSTLPASLTAKIAPISVATALQPFLQRDAFEQGGAIAVFLGIPEAEIANQAFMHHQLLYDYHQPLGHGNNLFLSLSAKDDIESAPLGYRAAVITTHCTLAPWQNLSSSHYQEQKQAIGERLLCLARQIYPRLGTEALVSEIATPVTYERFLHRPQGAVGGVHQTLANANHHAVPHTLGLPGFWLAGDTTWPGLGTVACVMGSRIVADGVLQQSVIKRWFFFQGGSRESARCR